jgi:hypothetical protein
MRGRATLGGPLLAAAGLLAVPCALAAQRTPSGLPVSLAALSATPLGALPPAAPSMPTSRDDTLLVGLRVQYAARSLPGANRLTTFGVGTDLQIQGRTIVSGVVGYQTPDQPICQIESCREHRLMAGVRFVGNLVTTRPFLRLPGFSGNSATGSAGFEIGGGWGQKAFGEPQHWTADVSMPLSLSVGQGIRVVPFATPALAGVWGVSSRPWRYRQRFMVSGGVGFQEIGQWLRLRGLDLTFALHPTFDPHGTALGVTLSWLHVP